MPQGTQPNQVETDRFAAPDAAGIVGTAPDDDFDFLARLAANVCETEMAAITFVDAERQFYKAAVGFKAPDLARDQSFCQHTVAAGSAFVVADALADDRFRASPLVSGAPRVRFYAGAPLRSSDGASFGALCVMDTRPRQLTAAQLGQLEGLAKQVTTLVESRRDENALNLARRRLDSDERLVAVAAWEWEASDDVAVWSPELRALLGVGDEVAAGFDNFLALVHPEDRDHVNDIVGAAIAAGDAFRYRARIMLPDDQVRTIDVQGEGTLDEAGNLQSMRGATADVTRLVEAERRSREQAAGLRAAFETALDPIFVVGGDRRFTEVNRAACRLLGYSEKELLAMRVEDVVARPGPADAIEIWTSFVEVGYQRGEIQLLRADGSRALTEFSATANFVPGFHLAVLRDVTERREAELDALQSRQRLEETQALAQVGSWEWDLGSELQIASDELLRILGRPTTGPTLSYKEFVSTVHPDDRESFLQVVERAMRTGESFRQVFRVVMESGEVRTIESHGRIKLDAKGKPVRMFGAAQDITDRERAAQDLRLQAEVLDQLPVAVIATGADRQITLWNDGAETIFAIDREHALGRRLDDLELLAPRSTEVRQRMTARLSEGLAWEGEIEVKDANGRIFPALVTNSPIRNELGEIISYVGVTMDMTERRTIESELRLQGQILDHVQSAVVALDHERRVTHWSKGAERLYGWTAEEVVGRPAAELALDGSRSGITRESVQEAVVADGRWEGEIEVRHKDGTTFPVLSTNSAILDASGEMIGFLGISLDISARKQAEEETHEARLETIKRLTRAVETRDPETGGHIERIGEFAAMLAQRLGLSADEVELIRVSSPMHDVGKIGIADEILLKPGPLTPEERSVMERHTKIGHDILAGSHSEILDMAALIALSHHERIDGRGYPLGLEADKIPLEGRIVAVADVFDALTSDRVYRPAFSTAKAIEIMREGRGTQFETQILDLLLGDLEAFSSLVFSNGHPRQPAEAA